MAIDAPTGRGPTHGVGAGDLEPTLPGLGPDPAQRSYAGWLQRVLAYLLDTAIVSSVAFLALGPVGSPAILPGFGPGSTSTATDSGWLVATAVALTVLQAYTGSTPGKRTVGIVVVREETGRPAGLVVTVLRWLAHVLDSILLIGFLRPLWHPQRKTFADSLLGTVVISSVRPIDPHPWVAALRGRRADAPRTGADAARPARARLTSRLLTAGATLLCVTAAAFALTPGYVTSDDLWHEVCTPVLEPGASTAPLTLEQVDVRSYSTERTETRWGVTRTASPPEAPDRDGLEATYAVVPSASATADVPVDAELVLALSTWKGEPLGEWTSSVVVTPHPDGGSTHELVTAAPGSDVGTVHVPQATIDGLDPAWRWEASLRVDGATVASCAGRDRG
ncbi:RDD family protein [Cellulosimicrobium cellulans]|uniref:RDD family protein n=1 Tax=Cellulosimicrobium cellulans TaxID=1710 RepID=UPI00084920EB|nr:RDD family protein [Cellulosimicrobium cellulans]